MSLFFCNYGVFRCNNGIYLEHSSLQLISMPHLLAPLLDKLFIFFETISISCHPYVDLELIAFNLKNGNKKIVIVF